MLWQVDFDNLWSTAGLMQLFVVVNETEPIRLTSHPEISKDSLVYQFSTLYMLAAVLIGVPANILTIIVISRGPDAHPSTFTYVSALCIVDSVYLIVSPFSTVIRFYINEELYEFGKYCGSWIALAYSLANASNLIFISLTVDRFMAVYQPLKSLSRRTRSFAQFMIVICLLVGIVTGLPQGISIYGPLQSRRPLDGLVATLLGTNETFGHICIRNIVPAWKVQLLSFAQLFFGFVILYLTIIPLNVAILWKIRRQQRKNLNCNNSQWKRIEVEMTVAL